jgi:hypothetical protein
MSKVRLATKEDFDEMAGQGDFNTLDWEFLEKSALVRRSTNVSACVETAEGKYVVPLLKRRVLGFYPVAESLPFGLYGGVLPCTPGTSPSAYVATMKAASRFLGIGIVFQNPFHQDVLSQSGLEPVVETSAHIVHTEGRVYADMLAKVFEHKMRKNVKRAIQNDVTIRVGRSPELVRDFYRMYEISNVRWGRKEPRYGIDFFLTYAKSPFLEVRVAYSGDQPAAALIMLRFRNYYFGWFGAMNKELSNIRANDLLHADLIKSAIEAGVKYVNFGASRNSAGVKKFKESFGATEHFYGVYFVGNPIARAALKRALGATT